MICPKCNRKYEDDMPRCLWCDALKPNYGMDGPLPDNQKDVEKREIFDESFEDGSIFKLENDKHVVNVLAILYRRMNGITPFYTSSTLQGYHIW